MHLNSGAYKSSRDIESPEDRTCPECKGFGDLDCLNECDGGCEECDDSGVITCDLCRGWGQV